MSLRLRLWLACVSGGAIAGLGSLWVLGTRVRPEALDPATLLGWLAAVAIAAVVSGLLLALWLDHHIVGHLRGLVRGLRSGRVAELRGLPAAAGWGELSELTDVAQDLLARQRRSARAAEDLEQVRAQLVALQGALEQWLRTETWDAPKLPSGPLTVAADALARGLSRRAVVDEQNVTAARQVAGELADAVADAQESAEQAERGFVEATALLTTVRELQRLSGELQGALGALGTAGVAAPAEAAPPAAVPAEAPLPAPVPVDASAAREAVELLVEASQESVEAIGRGMLRVQDVSDLVQQLANRATLVAIHAVTGSHREADEELARELKQLVQDVREATDRTARFAQEIEQAVTESAERMREARERAAVKLEELPVAVRVVPVVPAAPAVVSAPAAGPATVANTRALDDAHRLLERVREMVQDAARKGERLSAAGERASRSAERLSRRVAEEAVETQALVVRMTPVGEGGAPREASAPRELRLLEGAPGAEPEAGERRGEERP